MNDTMAIFQTLHGWLESNICNLDAIIFDIDGVLLVRGESSMGSQKLIEMLRRERFPFYLLTNDGDHSTEEKAATLDRAGLCVLSDEIVSCSDGLMELADGLNSNEEPFFIMGNLGNPCFAKKAGLKTTRDLESINICQGIIVGERNYDWEKTINAAVNFFIRKPHASLIVPNPDEYYPGQCGEICIAAGGVARFIVQIVRRYGITIEPLYLGKPFLPIFRKTRQLLEEQHGRAIPLDRILMVGDYINSDIRGAKDFGCRSAIVLTGVTTMNMLERSAILPDMVFQILGE